jgi:hypothetical protein
MSWICSSLALIASALLLVGCEARCPPTAHSEEHDLGGLHSKVCVNSLAALDGPSVSWAGTQQKVFEGNFEPAPPRFEKGNPSGQQTWWYENGNTRAMLEFAHGSAGVFDGRSRFWNHDGKLLYDVSYRAGVPEGRWTAWHPGLGGKAFEGSFKNGKRQGTWRYWYVGGKLGAQAEYLEGKPSGTWVAWRSDGAQALKMNFVQGRAQDVHGAEPTPDFYKTPNSELTSKFAIKFPHSVDEAYTSMDFTRNPDDQSPAIPAGSIDEQVLSGAFEHTLGMFGALFVDLKTYGQALSPFGDAHKSAELSQSGWLKFDVTR